MGNYHEWGDEDFDWNGLCDAMEIIRRVCKIFRIGVHIKEKYGTIRCSVYPFRGSLHDVIYPGYVANQFPRWLWNLDCNIARYVMRRRPMLYVTCLIAEFQMHVGYRLAFYIAMKKYPHIREEICVDVEGTDYITGGKEIHDKYWKVMK